MISDEFNKPDIQERWQNRKMMSSSVVAEWDHDTWALWLRDSLELYTPEQDKWAFAPFYPSYSPLDHGGGLDAGLYDDVPKLIQDIKRVLHNGKKQAAFPNALAEAAADKDFLQKQGAAKLLYIMAEAFDAPRILTTLLKSEAAGLYALDRENLSRAAYMLQDMAQSKAGDIPSMLLHHVGEMSDPARRTFFRTASVKDHLKSLNNRATGPETPAP